MTLENAKKAKELVEKIEKKDDLIKYYKESSFGLADCYVNTIKKMREIVVGRLEKEKKALEDELTAL